MPHRPSDPGIPTLTQRAEPTLSPSTPPPDAPLLTEVAPERASAHDGDAFPLLTDVARHDDAFPLLTDVARDDDAFPLLTDVARDDDALPLLTDVARDDDAFPLLTDVAQDGADASRSAEAADTPALPPPAAVVAPAAPATASPEASVLAARLQAEVEQVMFQALADAIEQIQARMDEELPRIVARVMQDVRPG